MDISPLGIFGTPGLTVAYLLIVDFCHLSSRVVLFYTGNNSGQLEPSTDLTCYLRPDSIRLAWILRWYCSNCGRKWGVTLHLRSRCILP